MDKILIGLVAPKQSGKDTVADYLCTKYNFEKYNFGDPLKEGVGKIFGFTDEQLYGDKKEIIDNYWGVAPREVYQKIGTEIFQYEVPKLFSEMSDIGRLFWVKCFEKWYIDELTYFETENVVISDVRFLHESNKIKEMGGILIKVQRDVDENEYSLHSSETELKDIVCDYTLNNNGSIKELIKEIDELISSFK